MTTHSNIIAISDATTPSGNIVMWALHGSVSHTDLVAAWEARGGDATMLPKPTKPARALRRALHALAGKRRLVRPLGQDRGHALVDERATDDSLEHHTGARARVEGGALRVHDADPETEASIAQGFVAHQGLVLAADIGDWLVSLVPSSLDGVALRPKGGVYFVPPHATEMLDRIDGTLRAVGIARIFRVPAMRSADAVETILHAVQNEARDAAVVLAEALADGTYTTRRGWEARVADLDALEAKVARYEALLGSNLDAFKAKLVPLRAGLAAAALAADTRSEQDAHGGGNAHAGFAGLAAL